MLQCLHIRRRDGETKRSVGFGKNSLMLGGLTHSLRTESCTPWHDRSNGKHYAVNVTLCSCHKINRRDSQVYEVLVPTDDDKFLRQTLHIFAQFATEIRCSAEDLAKERGAVLEVGGFCLPCWVE